MADTLARDEAGSSGRVSAPFASTRVRWLLCAASERLKNLSLLPTCGTKFYQYKLGWEQLYSEDFTDGEKTKIISSLKQTMELSYFKAERTWGEVIEDRGSQITFSALGQQAPIEEKKKWDPDFTKRRKMKERLDSAYPRVFRASGWNDIR